MAAGARTTSNTRSQITRGVRAAVVAVASLALALGLGLPTLAEEHASEPNDPLWEHQWGPQQINAHLAWPYSTGEGTTIAIVDSGVDLTHEDLVGNVVAGTTFIEGCRDEEDRRDNPECNRDGDWEDGEEDGNPHGTHVAGIAGAVTDNGIGIAGVAPDTTLLAVKVLDSSGSGEYEDVAAGIVWAVDHGADVINLSLAAPPGAQVFTIIGAETTVLEAIEYAHENGVLVVAAAGNEAFPLCDDPAWSEGVVCVRATDRREAPSAYSNWPNKPDMIGLAAPGGSLIVIACGEGVLSTVPEGEGIDSCDYPENEAYDEYDGTSMSAPHVAGVGALLYALGCDREQSIEVLTSTARTPPSDARGQWDPLYGYGIVDAEAAVTEALEVCEGSTTGDDDNGDDGNGNDDDDNGDDDGERERGDSEDKRRDADRGDNRDERGQDNGRDADRGDNRDERGQDNGRDDEQRRDADEDERDEDEDEDEEDDDNGGFLDWFASLVATLRGFLG